MDGTTTARPHSKLRAYLEILPDTIPIRTEVDGTYGFDVMNVDDDDTEASGSKEQLTASLRSGWDTAEMVLQCESTRVMLQHEYGNAYTKPGWPDTKKRMKVQNPLLAQYHPADALRLLKEQLVAYSKSLGPLDRPVFKKTECT
ncbi:hypothetical protein EV363DRAFT_1072955, partial [Boletus edulis]